MKKKIIDITGTPLTPSIQGWRCLGNGNHKEYEICCENCDYFLKCFPQYDPYSKTSKFIKWFKTTFKVGE